MQSLHQSSFAIQLCSPFLFGEHRVVTSKVTPVISQSPLCKLLKSLDFLVFQRKIFIFLLVKSSLAVLFVIIWEKEANFTGFALELRIWIEYSWWSFLLFFFFLLKVVLFWLLTNYSHIFGFLHADWIDDLIHLIHHLCLKFLSLAPLVPFPGLFSAHSCLFKWLHGIQRSSWHHKAAFVFFRV